MRTSAAVVFLLLVQYSSASYLFISGYSSTVRTFSLDAVSGAITSTDNVTSNQVTWLNWRADSSVIYGANEIDSPNKLTSFKWNKAGDLTVLNTAAIPGHGPVSTYDYSGKFLFASGYSSGNVTVHALSTVDGSIGQLVVNFKAGVNAHQVTMKNNYAFVICKGSDYVAQYIFDATAKTLKPNSVAATVKTPTGSGPRHIAFHPLLNVAYVLGEFSSEVYLMTYTPTQGTLTYTGTKYSTIPGFTGTNTGAEIRVTPNGKWVYASNRGNNTIAIFAVNAADGRLTFAGCESANGQIKTPRSFDLDGNGAWMVVANQGGSSITILKVNNTSGQLKHVQTMTGFQNPAFAGIYDRQFVNPTTLPTTAATKAPTTAATKAPTTAATKAPTTAATKAPTTAATKAPTTAATKAPTTAATKAPTTAATKAPTTAATKAPTTAATKAPTTAATKAPTTAATKAPTTSATKAPTTAATEAPTTSPTTLPTLTPTPSPSANRTVVLFGTSDSIRDANQNIWALNSSGQITVNGVVDVRSANVRQLAYVNSRVWQMNTQPRWWYKTLPSDTWLPVGGQTQSPL